MRSQLGDTPKVRLIAPNAALIQAVQISGGLPNVIVVREHSATAFNRWVVSEPFLHSRFGRWSPSRSPAPQVGSVAAQFSPVTGVLEVRCPGSNPLSPTAGASTRLDILLGNEARSFGLSSGVTFGELADLLGEVSAYHREPVKRVEMVVTSKRRTTSNLRSFRSTHQTG